MHITPPSRSKNKNEESKESAINLITKFSRKFGEGSNHVKRFNILNTNIDANTNNNMKAKKKFDYITNNNDLTKIKTDEVSSSSVFNKEKKLSQNKNYNSNNTKVSPNINFQSNNTTTKPKTVKDKKIQRTYNDKIIRTP